MSWLRDILIYSIIALSLSIGYYFGGLHAIQENDRLIYWLGVAGGSFMLAAIIYAARKNVKILNRVGTMPAWINAHMILGVIGPSIIIAHSSLSLRSFNATIAFWTMLVVMFSGIVGRYLYIRSMADLTKEQERLSKFMHDISIKADPKRRNPFHYVPLARRMLIDFEKQAVYDAKNLSTQLLHLVFILPFVSWKVRIQAVWLAYRELQEVGKILNWSRKERLYRFGKISYQTSRFFTHLMKVALIGGWKRLFKLWHVAHLPFIYLLVIASIAHIISVHIY